MPAVGFQPRFVVLVWQGSKCQTIRPLRFSAPFRTGGRLAMYAGWRTPRCVKIGEAEIRGVARVRFEPAGTGSASFAVRTGGAWLQESLEDVARRDGFDGPRPGDELAAFLREVHGRGPFEGHVVTWGELSWRCSSALLDAYLSAEAVAHAAREAKRPRNRRRSRSGSAIL